MNEFERAYRNFDMSFRKYVLVGIIPPALAGILVSLFLLSLYPSAFVGFPNQILLFVIPIFTTVAGVLYPLVEHKARAVKINQEMHMFLTHLGALSMSEMSESGFIELLKEINVEGEITKEMNEIVDLAKDMNVALPDACRIVSNGTPSDMLSDFLQRLAYALETQTSPKEFFIDEHKTFTDDFENQYDNMLFRLDLIRELYVASIIICVFGMTLSVVMPVLIAVDVSTLLFFTVGVYGFVTVGFLIAFIKGIPRTKLWCKEDVETSLWNSLKSYLYISLALAPGIFLILFLVTQLSLLYILGFSTLPFLVPAFLALKAENNILSRDSDYPSFIRALAANTPTRTLDLTKSLEKLRYHEFGKLGENIDALYQRLKLKISTTGAWRHFGAETGSYLINRFTDMYLQASTEGAKPEDSVPVISDNFILSVGLRDKKLIRTRSLIGVLGAMMASITVVLVASHEIISSITDVLAALEYPTGVEFPLPFEGIIHPTPVVFDFFEMIIFGVIVAQAAVSSVLSWHIKGEHVGVSLGKFTVFLWIGIITAFLVRWSLDLLFSF